MKSKDDQKSRILSWMKTGCAVSQLMAFNQFGCCRLSERIRELEADGHAFNREWVAGQNAVGRPVRFIRYRLAAKRRAAK